MIVPIKRDGIVEDWAIIDLQGDLKFEKADHLNDQLIGDLHFTKTGVPILIIGIHVLHGKEVTLEKPLIVLRKHRNVEREVTGEQSNVEEDDTTWVGERENSARDTAEDQSDTMTRYVVKAVVRKKLLFRSRPKPIVTNVPKPC